MKKPDPLYYIAQGEQGVTGPYDLVQLAELLRKKTITSQTLTCVEGEHEWEPFGYRDQFQVAKEMSPDATSKRTEELAEKALSSRSPFPMPSAKTMGRLAGMALMLLIASLVVYVVAREDTLTGICLAVGGGALALLGQCMILVKLMDEDYWTIVMVFFVPFYDVYYFLYANFWDYLPYFGAKYIGGILTAAALAGIACGNSAEANELRACLHFYGQ